ncbi:SLAM family member 5 [Echinops telfairi]|uniref:SLAM family member 5 n=1 Tax=Echinops telfairi TaxID=9371 RepID=A0AC55DRE8_ECHTE|nr:SLAM family member 5 [Echinops telfairi]
MSHNVRPEVAGRDTGTLMVNGILGESVTLPVDIPESQKVMNIAWISKSSVAVVQPGESGSAPRVTVTHKNYFNRLHVVNQSYSLVISSLRMADSGFYQADINILSNDFTITKNYTLQVYRRLEKPKITQSLMIHMNSSCNVTLTCSVEKEEKDVTYRWSPLGEGNILRIFQTPEDQELTYTCTVWNPVSNNSGSIAAQHLCADITNNHHTGLLSGLIVLFLVIIPPVLLCYLYKRRQGPCLKTLKESSDTFSNKIVYEPITAQRNTQLAETRVYDEVSMPKVLPSKEEPKNTVYSIVQFTDKMEKTSTCGSKPLGTSSYETVI